MACGRLEMDILNSIWNLTSNSDGKDISIQDVVEELSAGGIERAYTTIKTVMDRLTAKSILVRYKSGKKFFYSAAMDREEMVRENIKELGGRFFGGNYADMIRLLKNNLI